MRMRAIDSYKTSSNNQGTHVVGKLQKCCALGKYCCQMSHTWGGIKNRKTFIWSPSDSLEQRSKIRLRICNSCTRLSFCLKKSGSLLLLGYFSNMGSWISPMILTIFLTTWLRYLQIFLDFICVGHTVWAHRARRTKSRPLARSRGPEGPYPFGMNILRITYFDEIAMSTA